MSDDPLAQYRRTSTAPATGGVHPSEAGSEYLAFGTKDKVRRLRIRPANDTTHSPGYNALMDIAYDGVYGTNFMLVYTVLMVLVKGKNLQKLIFAIENDMADYIQAFDPKRWAKPTDAAAPFIESIEVTITDSHAPDGESEH